MVAQGNMVSLALKPKASEQARRSAGMVMMSWGTKRIFPPQGMKWSPTEI